VSIEKKIYECLGRFDGFYTHPPMDDRKLYIKGELIKFGNDGHEIYLGNIDRWHYFFDEKTFRKLAIWYLMNWVFIDWFGLRSWIWFKLLSRNVRR